MHTVVACPLSGTNDWYINSLTTGHMIVISLTKQKTKTNLSLSLIMGRELDLFGSSPAHTGAISRAELHL